jgi:hypothetical protein
MQQHSSAQRIASPSRDHRALAIRKLRSEWRPETCSARASGGRRASTGAFALNSGSRCDSQWPGLAWLASDLRGTLLPVPGRSSGRLDPAMTRPPAQGSFKMATSLPLSEHLRVRGHGIVTIVSLGRW